MWICMSSFWLTPFCICSTLWWVGTDWNLQFGDPVITSKYKFKKNKESYLAKSNCSDVLGLLILMLNTPLEHHSSLSKQRILWCWQSRPLLLINASLLTLPTCIGKSARPLLISVLNCWQSICYLIVGLITHPRHCLLLMPVIFLMRSIEI
jgi:hypothetical protein